MPNDTAEQNAPHFAYLSRKTCHPTIGNQTDRPMHITQSGFVQMWPINFPIRFIKWNVQQHEPWAHVRPSAGRLNYIVSHSTGQLYRLQNASNQYKSWCKHYVDNKVWTINEMILFGCIALGFLFVNPNAIIYKNQTDSVQQSDKIDFKRHTLWYRLVHFFVAVFFGFQHKVAFELD